MKKQTKQLIALLVILAVCILAYFGVSRLMAANQNAQQEDPALTVGELSGELASLSLSHNSETIVFTCADGVWSYSDPAFPVDQSAVSALAKQLSPLTATLAMDMADTLDAYGLAVPACTVTVTDDQGGSYTLLVGDATLSSGYYASTQADPDTLYVLEEEVVSLLLQDPYSFMQFDQFDSLSEDIITQITLQPGSGDALTFTKETVTTTIPAETEGAEETTQTSYLWSLDGVRLSELTVSDAYLASLAEGEEPAAAQDLLADALSSLASLSFDSCLNYQAAQADLLAEGEQDGALPLTVTVSYTGTEGEALTTTLYLGSTWDDSGSRLAMKDASPALYLLSGADPLFLLAVALG